MSKNNKTIVKTITYRTSDCELKIAKPMLMPETKYLSSYNSTNQQIKKSGEIQNNIN